ncbi:hypothetical protein PSR1_02695 [Anaeromyxobacter sp. PSR-1]|nr:hypothetical protein PSR1_02695 [Anaeromyxobacter sp. PSR-1]
MATVKRPAASVVASPTCAPCVPPLSAYARTFAPATGPSTTAPLMVPAAPAPGVEPPPPPPQAASRREAIRGAVAAGAEIFMELLSPGG